MKKCGNKEPCFEQVEMWGHFEHDMCKYLGEKTDETGRQVSVCNKTGELIEFYWGEPRP